MEQRAYPIPSCHTIQSNRRRGICSLHLLSFLLPFARECCPYLTQFTVDCSYPAINVIYLAVDVQEQLALHELEDRLVRLGAFLLEVIIQPGEKLLNQFYVHVTPLPTLLMWLPLAGARRAGIAPVLHQGGCHDFLPRSRRVCGHPP